MNRREYSTRTQSPDSLLPAASRPSRRNRGTEQLHATAQTYRPGVGRTTSTLPAAGSRTVASWRRQPGDRAAGIQPGRKQPLSFPERLNGVGWDVESLSSRQRVYGVLAELATDLCIPEQSIGASYPTRLRKEPRGLLRNLACLNVGRSTTSGSKGFLVS